MHAVVYGEFVLLPTLYQLSCYMESSANKKVQFFMFYMHYFFVSVTLQEIPAYK